MDADTLLQIHNDEAQADMYGEDVRESDGDCHLVCDAHGCHWVCNDPDDDDECEANRDWYADDVPDRDDALADGEELEPDDRD